MISFFFLVLVLLTVGIRTAPTRNAGGESNSLDGDDNRDFILLGELKETLTKGLLNNQKNVEKIKSAFRVKPRSKKICVPFTYMIHCSDQEECYNETTSLNCSNTYSSKFMWTTFNVESFSGHFLYLYAPSGIEIFGFEWSGACKVISRYSEIEGTTLNINVSSLPCMDTKKYLEMTLSSITKEIHSYGNISTDEESFAYEEDDRLVRIKPMLVVVFISMLILTCTLPIIYHNISTIMTPRGDYKLKPYLQFWAAHFFILGFGIMLCARHKSQYFFVPLILVVGTVGSSIRLIMWAVNKLNLGYEEPHKLNTPTHCCTGKLKTHCHFILTFVSAVITSFFFAFLIICAPSLLLVYSVYPARTLIRLPFILSAILYINSTIALLIYYVEKCVFKLKNNLRPQQYHESLHKTADLSKLLAVVAPLGVFGLLIALLLIVSVLSELTFSHSEGFEDDQLGSFIALLPTFLVFFGSLYKKDLFFVDQENEDIESKTEKEYLNLMLKTGKDSLSAIEKIEQEILMQLQRIKFKGEEEGDDERPPGEGGRPSHEGDRPPGATSEDGSRLTEDKRKSKDDTCKDRLKHEVRQPQLSTDKKSEGNESMSLSSTQSTYGSIQ